MSSSTVNWSMILDDDDMYEPYTPTNSWGKSTSWAVDNMAFIKICLHEDQANDSRATKLALEKFKEKISIPSGLKNMSIIERARRILFTSIKIEYTIEIIASKEAVEQYYSNFIEEKIDGRR
jgi:hypothetical protein